MRALLALLLLGTVAAADEPSLLDRSMRSAWPPLRRWGEAYEREYATFVAKLGDAVEARRCARLDECLRQRDANMLYDRSDAGLTLAIDCADLPYVLRAYFAMKRQLPFGFVSRTTGRGTDMRRADDVAPAEWMTWRDFATPRELLTKMVDLVHSGMYRTAPEIEDDDFYPVRLARTAIRPGAVFYDPGGHVAVVARVRDDGAVYFIDGHPDGSLTWRRFGASWDAGPPQLGGGFKAFRPMTLEGNVLTRWPNRALREFEPKAVGGGEDFPQRVRAALAKPGVAPDVRRDFREAVNALCRDVSDRTVAVDAARVTGVAAKPHPSSLPDDIYATSGEWEQYATAARDVRLRAEFRELADLVRALPPRGGAMTALGKIWLDENHSSACHFAYRGSSPGGAAVRLTLNDVMDRLWSLSFDPYHCVELRWGAPEGSPERAACPDDEEKIRWYNAEQRTRNRVTRGGVEGLGAGVEGPEAPDPAWDVRNLLVRKR